MRRKMVFGNSWGNWIMKIALFLSLLAAYGATAQDNLAARRLYYQDNAPEVVFKATTVAQKQADAKPVAKTPVAATRPVAQTPTMTASKAQQIEKIQQALREAATTALSNNGPALKPAANLGVRYN